MDKKTITVQGVSLEVTTPYAEGHKVSEAEAKALNQVRAENIANNKRAEIKKMLEEDGATVESVQKAAQKLVTAYDGDYEFTLASVGGGGASRLTPLEKEARKLARNWIGGKLKEMGMTQAAYLEQNGEDAIKIKVAELCEHPEIIKAAEENIKARSGLADLGSL